MGLTFALAWRNLWRNSRRTLLAGSAVAFMVLLLIFVLSMQFGSYHTMVDHGAGIMYGHAQIQREDYVDEPRVRFVLDNAEEIAASVRTMDGVRGATPRAMSSALASKDESTFGAMVMGVDPTHEASVSWLPGTVSTGRYLQTDATQPEAVIGSVLARNLGLKTGDEIVLLGVTPQDGVAVLVANVVGLLSSGQTPLDRALVQVPLGLFQEAFEMTGAAHSVAVMYDDYGMAATDLENVEASLLASPQDQDASPGGAVNVALWNRLMPEIEGAIASDKASSGVMYAVLVVLVTFSIANTFVMMLFERTREFGTLLAMGVKPGQLRMTIAIETLLLAGLGTLVGAILGAAIAWGVGKLGISVGSDQENLLAQFQLPDRIYFGVAWHALWAAPLLMIVTTQIAAFLATRRVHQMRIVDAIREEM